MLSELTHGYERECALLIVNVMSTIRSQNKWLTLRGVWSESGRYGGTLFSISVTPTRKTGDVFVTKIILRAKPHVIVFKLTFRLLCTGQLPYCRRKREHGFRPQSLFREMLLWYI